MIDLNSKIYDYDKTRESILEDFSDYYLFCYYLGESFTINTLITSPLRGNDSKPSFTIFKGKNGLMFKDFGGRGTSGDIFVLVKELFSLSSYKEAILKVYEDVYKGESSSQNIKRDFELPEKKKKILRVKIRKWKDYDLTFWNTFGICLQTLKKFKVLPVEYIFLDYDIITADKYSYVFIEQKDGKLSMKVYQPFSSNLKWITDHDYSVHQGYTQLPLTGELLIITKSLKDVMSIYDVMNIPSIGVQSETVKIKTSVMQEYKDRFKKVICLFDKDPQGISLANDYKQWYNLDIIFVPEERSKDFSGMVRDIGIVNSKIIFKNLINQIYET